MNIKVPTGIKSPTVVIIGGGTMAGDDKFNKLQEKRMDLLEKKFDQRYKNITEGKVNSKDNYKDIELIHKSFIKKLNKFISLNKQIMESKNSELIEALKKTMNKKVYEIKESVPKSDNQEIKAFVKKIDSLEDAIRNISLKTKTVNVNRKVSLDGSFDKFFSKIESAIKQARPRMYPSPS